MCRFLTVVIGALSVACSSPSSSLTLSAKAGPPSTSAAVSNAVAFSPGPSFATSSGAVTSSTSAIDIDRVRVVVGRVLLERSTPFDFEHAEEHVHLDGPFLVDLAGAALGGAVTTVATLDGVEGRFSSATLEIRPLASGELPAAALGGSSVVVDGRRDGVAFRLETGDRFEQRHVAPFDLGSGDENLTLGIDAAAWFLDPVTGASLDPELPANHHTIMLNIQRSLLLFEDGSRSGEFRLPEGGGEHGIVPGPLPPPGDGDPGSGSDPLPHQH